MVGKCDRTKGCEGQKLVKCEKATNAQGQLLQIPLSVSLSLGIERASLLMSGAYDLLQGKARESPAPAVSQI